MRRPQDRAGWQGSSRADALWAHPRTLVLVALLLVAACAPFTRGGGDDRLRRVELLALLQTLNADLLSHDSATLTLERWCADHRLAQPAKIVARRERDATKAIPAELRARLGIGPHEVLGYRRVRLVCGERVLSEADNWYVPARLTDAMNRALDTTDEPFGRVVAALDFQRRTLSAELLWSPLPPGWEMISPDRRGEARTPVAVPHAVLRHTAILYSAAQTPFSALVETYTGEVIDFRTR
ncbi:MAG: hypothetical protein ABI846_14955 [Rudaea sp.]